MRKPDRTNVDRANVADHFREAGEFHNLAYRVLVGRLGFTLNRVTPLYWPDDPSRHLLTLYLKPNRELKDALSLTGAEVICVFSTFPSIDYRAVKAALDGISDTDRRPEAQLALVLAAPTDVQREIESLAAQELTSFVSFSFDELRQLVDRPEDCLPALRRKAASKDLYNLRTAVRSSHDFFGRRGLLSQVQGRLLEGSAVGLFGLRKVGKTSFLMQLLERLRQHDRVISSFIDFQVVDAIDSTREYFFLSIAQAIGDSLNRKQRSLGYSVIGRPLSDIADRSSAPELMQALRADLHMLVDRLGLRVVIAIDEIDIMLSRNHETPWQSSFVPIWRFLRGISQEMEGKVTFFLTGTNPHLVECTSVDGADNPLLLWIDKQYIGPLQEEESNTMLASIGNRMHLHWEVDALRFVFARVAGHPLLTRMYGTAVHQLLRDRTEECLVDTRAARQCLETLRQSAAPILNMVLELMREQYPDDHEMLRLLAESHEAEFRDMYHAMPETAEHLIGYGIVCESDGEFRVAFSLVQEWIKEREQERKRASMEEAIAQPTALEIDGFKEVQVLSRAGGLADVYKAVDIRSNNLVAIKVFRYGSSMSTLQRECDVLEGVRHNSIVRLYGTGKLVDGRPYLVMELLRGQPLSEFLTPSRRFATEEALECANDVLDALSTIHPRDVRIDSSEELSFEDYIRMQREKSGYVHRDIKPDNIMAVPERGYVLFDFNISSPAGAPIRTLSYTPGYRSGSDLSEWRPATDLYALGVTLAELLAGQRRRDESQEALDELLRTASGYATDACMRLVRRLCYREEPGIESAAEALRIVKELRTG